MAASFSTNFLVEKEWLEIVGQSGVVFESMLFSFASHFTRDDLELGVNRYAGGNWALERFATEEGVYFWFRLESSARYRWVNADNYSDEVVDAQMLSMVTNLIASSNMCFHLMEEQDKAKAAGRSQVVIDRINKRNEYFANLHHAARDHFLALLGENNQKKRLLLQLID